MNKLIVILFLLVMGELCAQESYFQFYLESIDIPEVEGLQAFVTGQHAGIWLILGGRIDGLHQRQPWASFDEAGMNNQIIVIDPANKQKWNAPLTSLSADLQEQLSSTNMQFQQNGNMLYCVGGYGYSASALKHITHNKLTAIDVPATIEAVINNKPFSAFFRQISNAQFAVAGAYLAKIYDTYYLVGGNKFEGRYNPANMATFTQEYTNQIRKFELNDDGTNISVTFLTPITDAENLHRRDYNLVPQIMPNREQGLTAFSGVFQKDHDLPFLNCVNIDSSAYAVNNSFAQYYNHYHCAVLPLYSETENEMHSVFFGGIAQYYDDEGVLTQDNNVPFVKTIARVTRDSKGNMAEFKLPVEMPGLLGAGSEFIPNGKLEYYNNKVLKLDKLGKDTTFVGHIYGGINSSAPNIFFINDGTQSIASKQIFKVSIIKNSAVGLDELNKQSIDNFMMQVHPNPNAGEFIVRFKMVNQNNVRVSVYNMLGRLIYNKTLTDLTEGINEHRIQLLNLKEGGTFMVSIQSKGNKAMQKVVIH